MSDNGIVYKCSVKPDGVSSNEIAAIYAVNLESDRTYVFCHPNYRDFQNLIYTTHLNDGLICGYESSIYDDNICTANGIAVKTGLDLFKELNSSWKPNMLHTLARINNLNVKLPMEFNSCLVDLFLTKKLIMLWLEGKLIDKLN